MTRIHSRPTLHGRHTFERWVVLAAGTADELVIFENSSGVIMKVERVAFIPDNAITGHATNYMGLQLRNKGAAGTGTTSIMDAVFNFDTPTTDDVAAMDAKELTLHATAANLQIANNDVVAMNKTEAASGMALQGLIKVEVSYL